MFCRPLLAAALAALCCVALPASAQVAEPGKAAASKGPAEQAQAALPDDELIVRYPPPGARWRTVVAGAGITAVAFGGAAIMGAAWDQVPGSDMLFIPVAGPWMALSESGCAPDEETSPAAGDCVPLMGLRGALFVIDGLLQAAGLAIVGEGILMTTAEPDATPKAAIMPVPIVTENALGVGVVGTF